MLKHDEEDLVSGLCIGTHLSIHLLTTISTWWPLNEYFATGLERQLLWRGLLSCGWLMDGGCGRAVEISWDRGEGGGVIGGYSEEASERKRTGWWWCWMVFGAVGCPSRCTRDSSESVACRGCWDKRELLLGIFGGHLFFLPMITLILLSCFSSVYLSTNCRTSLFPSLCCVQSYS